MKYPKDFYTSTSKKAGAKKTRKTKSAKAENSTATPQRLTANPPGESSYCDLIANSVDRYIRNKCEDNANQMTSLDEAGACPGSGDGTGGSTASGGVDLIVLIDSSGSMAGPAGIISEIAPKAFDAARERCDAAANVTYLYVDRSDSGVDPITGSFTGIFTTSHERHLVDVAGASGPFSGDGDGSLDAEQGARAISDLSQHNNWTPGNCRAILYVSDEKLDSISKSVADSRAAADLAITAANSNNVAIFSHFIDGSGSVGSSSPDRPTIASHYQDMSDQTGGHSQIDTPATTVNEELYIDLISRAICEGCGNSGGCHTAILPELEPCVSISWGDSECDCMEGDDHEEICISICNCYDNVTFQNVKIGAIVITDENGRRPPRLPDGSPSTELYPVGPYCFGDIGPCKDDEKSCVSRNAMIINRGLPPGTWKVRIIGLCFDVTHHYDERIQEFEFTVCKN